MSPLGKFLPIVGQPDPAQPKDIHLVGRYAIGVTWGDDHGSIYPFDRLRHDDPAGGPATEDALTEEMTWPKEIRKLPDALDCRSARRRAALPDRWRRRCRRGRGSALGTIPRSIARSRALR